MKRERTPAFYIYAFAIGVLFVMPFVAYAVTWALSKMDALDKYLFLLALALITLAYEARHTFNPK